MGEEAAPTFSVVVPTFGRQQLLDAALDSVREQTCPDFECIVVDDATPEPIRVPPDHRFRVVRRHSPGGPAAARNTGLDAAQGRYVAFLDSDDLYVDRRLEWALEVHDRASLAICWQSYIDERKTASGRNLEGDVSDVILDSITPHLGTVSIERGSCLPFDEQYLACEDVEWWLRQARNEIVATVPEVGYLVRRHDEIRHAGPATRAKYSRRLLADYPEYFIAHSRARAFRLRRIAHYDLIVGERRSAMAAAWSAFRIDNSPGSVSSLGRVLLSILRRSGLGSSD